MTLRIDLAIPAANAALVEVSDSPARVSFTPAPHGGPETLWFCFRVVSDGPGPGPLLLRLKHLSNLLGGNEAQNLRPVVRADDGDWQRLPAGQVIARPDGQLDVEWSTPRPERFADVALCYPYGRNELNALLDETNDTWRADEIGASQAGRPLVRLSNDYGTAAGERDGVYLLARQHAGETPGSWVLDGLLRRLAQRPDDAPLVWTVPLTNIDGVEQGDYGKDNFPHDLNRAWGRPPMRHETLVFQRDMLRWAKRCRPRLALDFHAPGGTENPGVYGFVPANDGQPEPRSRLLAQRLGEALGPYAAAEFARVANYPSRWETPNFTRFCRDRFEIPAVSLETPYALAGETVLTREVYGEIGSRLADALCRLDDLLDA
jgi:hypothetical protein